MTSPLIKVTYDVQAYTAAVTRRAIQLVETGVWDGLDKRKLKKWLNFNFTDDPEKYLAARILDAMVYRSKRHVVSSLRQAFDRTIPGLMRSHQSAEALDVRRMLQSHEDPGIRLLSIDTDDQTVGSSYVLHGYLRNELGLNASWMLRSDQIKAEDLRGVSLVLFVDDFVGTGTQFVDTYGKRLGSLLGSIPKLYISLLAEESGLRYIQSMLPSIGCGAVEILTPEHALFSSTSYDDPKNSTEAIRSFYEAFLADHNMYRRVGELEQGFGDLNLVVAFEHGVPRSSTPLLWWTEAPWSRLHDTPADA